MDLKRIIRLFYIGYTIFILMVINATSINFITAIPAIVFMWINYLVFSAGYSPGVRNSNSSHSINDQSGWLNNRNKVSLLFIAGISILFSILAVNYYTGQTPTSVFRSLSSSVSVYYEYQTHFKEQQRNIFSINKLPYIFMLFYIKIITFYSYISFVLSNNKMKIFEKYYIVIITLSFLYVGVARGTSFEFFEIIMLVIFIILSKQELIRFKIPIKNIVIVVVLISVVVFVFYLGINARGDICAFNISRDVFYDPNGILPAISQFITFVTLILYNYFGFGFFYMSIYLSDMWFSSIENFVAGLIPFGYLTLGKLSIIETMRSLVDIGARWHPDSAIFINNCGYLGLLMICFLMGVFSRNLQRSKNNSPIYQLTIFIILLQMISFPVGNFITVSSASQLIIISLMLYWIWKIFIEIRISNRSQVS